MKNYDLYLIIKDRIKTTITTEQLKTKKAWFRDNAIYKDFDTYFASVVLDSVFECYEICEMYDTCGVDDTHIIRYVKRALKELGV